MEGDDPVMETRTVPTRHRLVTGHSLFAFHFVWMVTSVISNHS